MSWFGKLRAMLGRHVLILDSVLAVAVAVFSFTVRRPDTAPGAVTPLPVAIAGALTGLALVGRRVWPRVTGAIVLIGTGVTVVLADGAPLFTVAVVIALYTIAAQTDRRTTVRACVAAGIIFLGSVTLVWVRRGLPFEVNAVSGLLGWTAIAAAFGDAVRSRRAYLAATEERAERAERTREEEARRRVVEERLRIAQELHDVVAHNVAVVSVQAGLADHLFFKQPDAARQALNQVQRASGTILDELAGILSVLRHPDEDSFTSLPAPGLDQLTELVDSYAEAGLPVDVSRHGDPRRLAPSADLVAYRVVQESLTNAHKHGGTPARVSVSYTSEGVALDVVNPLRTMSSTPSGTGHGIIGMRERAVAVGGKLRVDSEAHGEFRVHLALPAPVAQP